MLSFQCNANAQGKKKKEASALSFLKFADLISPECLNVTKSYAVYLLYLFIKDKGRFCSKILSQGICIFSVALELWYSDIIIAKPKGNCQLRK